MKFRHFTKSIHSLTEVLTEEPREPGDVWKTSNDKYRAMNPDRVRRSYDSEDDAKTWASGGEPEAEPGFKTKGYQGDKDKSLDDVDTQNSETFTEDIDPPDEDFVSPTKNGVSLANPTPPPPFQMPEIKSARFPKKYMKAIERMMNHQKSGTKPKTQDLIKGVGAGQAGSQAGEMLTLMCAGMDKEDWATLKKGMKDHEAALMAQDKVDLKNPKTRLVDSSWIDAAENNTLAVNRQVESMYGKGAKIVNTGWDVQADVEAMGWKGRYKESKGYSTDMYCKVEKADGSIVMHEPSLKKDDRINFINGSTGAFEDWNPDTKGGPLDPQTLATNESNRLTSALKGREKEVAKLAKVDPLKTQMADRGLTLDQVMNPSTTPGKARDKKKAAFLAMNAIAGAPKYGYQESGKQKGQVLTHDPPTPEEQAVVDHVEDVRKYCDEATNAIVDDPVLKQGMMDDIKKEFPLKGVADQEETMAIGPNSLDPATMEKIFGTTNFEEIKDDLVVDSSVKPPHLAYKGGKEGEMMQIATITIRQDGIGYGAPTVKFEMNMDQSFADRLAQANVDVYGELPQKEEVQKEALKFRKFTKNIHRN